MTTRHYSIKQFFRQMPNHYHRAMITYLDHDKCGMGATRFFRAQKNRLGEVP